MRMSHRAVDAVSACLCFGMGTAAVAQSSHPDIAPEHLERGIHDQAFVLNTPVLWSDMPLGAAPGEMFPVGVRLTLDSMRAASITPALSFVPENRALAERLGLTRMYVISLEEGVDSGAASNAIESLGVPGFHAQPVVVGEQCDRGDEPNDPGFPSQYGLHNLGQSVGGVTGNPDSDVDAFEAWSLQPGANSITIAVLDAGISHQHPDLMHKLLTGYNATGQGTIDDTDDTYNSHGTHVAGIAAAETNNGEGMTGMSWGSPIMPVKIANLLGFTSDVWLSEGLVWAADNEARVAVISFGLDSGSDLLHAAIQYATAQGVVVCASTGNTGALGVKYPAKYPETVAVAATDNQDRIAQFSTFGPEVSVAAPGVDVVSTWHSNGTPTYEWQSGTSVACPLVGGIASLVISADPTLTPAEVKSILQSSSEDLGVPGFDPLYGHGRVNAHRAVGAAMGIRICPADVNRNGRVDIADYTAWIDAFNLGRPEADQNGNGEVEPSDFSAFLLNYSAGCP